MKNTLEISRIEFLINENRGMELTSEELNVAKEVLNILHESAELISSPLQVLEFCIEALEYNPVSKFI